VNTDVDQQAPAISVLMPARNAQRYVAQAVRSVLQQSYGNLELVVIDDGSTDNTRAIVEEFGDRRVRILPGPGRGIAAAMNAALEAARAPLVSRCDADDLYPPGRLERQVHWMQMHPEFVAVCGNFASIARNGRLVSTFNCGATAEEITHELRAGTARTHFCTYTIRTNVLRAIGGFREYFVTGEDVDAALRLAEAGRVWYEPIVSLRYRLHDTSITHTECDARRAFFDAAAQRFQRQRLAGQPDDLTRGEAPVPPEPIESGSTGSSRHAWQILVGQAWREHDAGQHRQALLTGVRACLTQPHRLASWKNLGTLAVKRPRANRETVGRDAK
jgi:glycosyltransferase involved in cell wall biosynthesis